jgi:hypothetical protein
MRSLASRLFSFMAPLRRLGNVLTIAGLISGVLFLPPGTPGGGIGSARAEESLEARLEALPSDELEELLLFVAGNVLFTLYHEGGHMLVSEYGIPVLGQEEDAVDNLATIAMLAANDEDMDVLLTNAMIGWFLISEENPENMVFYGEHDLSLQRGYRALCLMVGSDQDKFGDLARDLELPEDRIQNCELDYEQALSAWRAVTDDHLRGDDGSSEQIEIVYEKPTPDHELIEIFLRESELIEEAADDFDTRFNLPNPITFAARNCNEENAFWDPAERELTLCYELMSGVARLYLDSLDEDK